MNQVMDSIPENWETKLFSEIAEFKNGINFSSDQKGGVGILTIDVLNMYGLGYSVVFDKLYRVNKDVSEGYILKVGDLLFVRSSLKLEGVGWTALFTGNIEPTTYCGFIIRARVNDNSFDNIFLTYYFRSYSARSKLISKSAKLGITNINQGNLGNITVPKPPLPEQKKIAHILSKIQKAIETQEQIIKTTQELKKALMQKLFTEGLNDEPQKQTEIGLMPESWDVVKLKDILAEDLKNGAFIKNPKYGSGYKYVNVVDIYESAILSIDKLPRMNVEFDKIKGYLLKENDIVFVRSSLKREGIGESCLIQNLNEYLFFDCHLIRISPDISKIDPDYLVQYFRSVKGKEDLIKRSKTTTMTTINQTNLSTSLLPYPKIDQQKYISSVLNKLDEKIVFYSIIRNNFIELFNTMLNMLMTGQIRVKDIEFKLDKE